MFLFTECIYLNGKHRNTQNGQHRKKSQICFSFSRKRNFWVASSWGRNFWLLRNNFKSFHSLSQINAKFINDFHFYFVGDKLSQFLQWSRENFVVYIELFVKKFNILHHCEYGNCLKSISIGRVSRAWIPSTNQKHLLWKLANQRPGEYRQDLP